MTVPTWEWCHQHGATTLLEDESRLACGCPITPSSRPSKGDA